MLATEVERVVLATGAEQVEQVAVATASSNLVARVHTAGGIVEKEPEE